jgi:hypothetical protein
VIQAIGRIDVTRTSGGIPKTFLAYARRELDAIDNTVIEIGNGQAKDHFRGYAETEMDR